MKNIKILISILTLLLIVKGLYSQDKHYPPYYCSDIEFELDTSNVERFDNIIRTVYISNDAPDTNLINRMISKIKWKDSVTTLVVRGNLITLPQSVFKLKQLSGIALSSPFFEDFTSRIGELKNLDYISYDFMNFDEWPKHFADIKNLKYLSVYSCGLGSKCQLIHDLSVFKYLEKFKTSLVSTNYNQCFDYLSELSSLKSLTIECRKIDSIPMSFVRLKNLEILSINEVAHVPEEILQMPNLKEIVLMGLDFKNDEEKCETLRYWKRKYPNVKVMTWSNCPDQRNKNEK